MRIFSVAFTGLFCTVVSLFGQVLTTTPEVPVASGAITIIFDTSQEPGELEDYTGKLYAHTGLNFSDGSRWQNVIGAWANNSTQPEFQYIGFNIYNLTLSPDLYTFYDASPDKEITQIAIVIRSEDGTKQTEDYFIDIYQEGLQINIISPAERVVILDLNDTIEIVAATSDADTIAMYHNGTFIKGTINNSITHTFTGDAYGENEIIIWAANETEETRDTVYYFVRPEPTVEILPESMIDGINYLSETSVLLSLYAPGKEYVFSIGDFSNWLPGETWYMKKTPDGDRFWITLNNLQPGVEYAYQYLVDGSLTIADPYTEKILDPWSDHLISQETYPDLKPFPVGKALSPVSIIQTAQPVYEWKNTTFVPPNPGEIVIYELLLRDFIQAHDWKNLVDSLDYFSRLGINAIELMPVNEFEGNESWGYNSSFYFAADKYYGPAEDLKAFIDSCHGRGIAVIGDLVLNHSYGQSPLVQLYFDNTSNKVAAENPWYNVDSPNPVFSWGYDFNHESQATMDFVDRVNSFWLEEYKVDGFRFDFTKGFTNTPGDGGAYDGARIAILKRMADEIWSVNPETYIILEHFADNTEEKELSNHGMMLWGNTNFNYNEATMGYNENGKSDFSWISFKKRGWNEPHVVGYMESHDEERLMYKNLTFGNTFGDYHIPDLNTALERMELAGAFFFTIPGPKMIWQFGELGYDYSIDYDCRVCNKPIRWDYFDVGNRRKLYQVWSALIDLKISEPAFESSDFNLFVSGAAKRIEINHTDMDVRIIGNFDVESLSINPSFSRSGWWYSYFEGDSIDVTDLQGPISLEAGEYRLYTTKRLIKPEITAEIGEYKVGPGDFHVYPNPVTGMLYMEPVPETSRLTILNSAGQIVKMLELKGNQDHVNLSSLPPGLYILSRQTGKEAPQYVKVIRE